jgi:hypothetical protein
MRAFPSESLLYGRLTRDKAVVEIQSLLRKCAYLQ